MSEEKIVTFDSSRRRPGGDRFAEFAETARRLQRERKDAPGIVAHHLEATPRDEWPGLAEEADLRTSGALEQLAALIRACCEKEPQKALILSTLATTIAETLPSGSYPPVTLAQLRAQAWKDHAHTLRFLGRFEEAFESIDMAESALAPFPATAYDKAVVGLVKASTLLQVSRFDESRALLAECRQIFQDHGDSRLFLYCGISEVALLFREEKHTEARELGLNLLTAASDAADRESIARLHNNVGYCDVHLGNLREANMHFAEAKSIFVDLGRTAEARRSDLGFGSLLIAKGHAAEGIAVLWATRADLLGDALILEAGLCGLKIAEAMLMRHNFDSAHSLISEIIDQFESAGLNDRAVRAMEYLSQSIEERNASAETVHHVEEYVELLRSNPLATFIPLSA
jgi:tetratricopeptide (TPR) repeat protein